MERIAPKRINMSIFDLFKKIEKQPQGGAISHIIVGLGNPGAEYEKTRHNAGFIAIDRLCDSLGVKCDRAKFKALTCEATIGESRVLIMKPQTYMNKSGEAISEASRFYKIPADKVIVISDDVTLAVGKLRIRGKGSAGGHNGLTNINELIGTQEYARIRMGIGNDFGRGQQVDYVLGELSAEEKEQMPELCKRVIDGVKAWALMGPDRAMNTLNTKPKPRPTEPEK